MALDKTCDVRMWRGPCNVCNGRGCDACRCGCFKPARHKNPFFGKDFYSDHYWWRGGYSYAEYLCADCYDRLVGDAKDWEDAFREHEGADFEENFEYTALLKTL